MSSNSDPNPTLALFPKAAFASAVVTSLLVTAFAITCILLGTLVFGDYGYLIFLGLPFAVGFLATLIHGLRHPRSFAQFIGVGFLAQTTLFISMIVLPLEGMGCLIMAFPLWFTCTAIGVCAAYPIHRARWIHFEPRGFPVAAIFVMLLVPTLMGAEYLVDPQPPLISVVTAVEIDAPPEVVWKNVVTFPPLAKPTDWVFSLGAAYPKQAVIFGHGPGAVRHCVFSTGAFVEPITTWQENHLLAFDVAQSPPSMQEWSPYENLHPPHVDGYLLSRRGQFLLTPLPGGRTRLEGTTWYQNYMFPAAYWQLWSDTVIHHIHQNVLTHIKATSEKQLAAAQN